MKVSIGYRLQDGPWGGGNQFGRALADALAARGDQVRFDLRDGDIDVILLTDPRVRSPSTAFGAGAIARYLALRNPGAIVVHRINECDERKGTRHVNRLMRRANYVDDHTVFVASWMRDLDVWRRESSASVILGGADPAVFDASGNRAWTGDEPLRLVTHHWGGNRLKGFDIYEMLDAMLVDPAWKDRIEFTYVGRIPDDAALPNARVVEPLAGRDLAAEIASHHVYVTGSQNEPSGMHHIEGAMSGLPLLYRQSGGLPEYCAGFGIAFDGPDDFVAALERMMAEYDTHKRSLADYPHTTERMCAGFIRLFDDLVARRDEIVAARSLWRAPATLLHNQLPA